MTDAGLAVIDALDRVAAQHQVSVPAAALAWELRRPAVAAPIIGANTPEQLSDLLPAADLDLTATEIADLDLASVSF